jgi:hypothetical protein
MKRVLKYPVIGIFMTGCDGMSVEHLVGKKAKMESSL